MPVPPAQKVPLPDTVKAVGNGYTVSTAVATQVPPAEYVIVVVPASTPPATPVVAPTVATSVLLLLQVPVPLPSTSGIVEFTHTTSGPVGIVVIGPGAAFTVTTAMRVQKVPGA